MAQLSKAWCYWGGQALTGRDCLDMHVENGILMCPGCFKAVKLRKHPSSGGAYMQVPRHKKEVSL